MVAWGSRHPLKQTARTWRFQFPFLGCWPPGHVRTVCSFNREVSLHLELGRLQIWPHFGKIPMYDVYCYWKKSHSQPPVGCQKNPVNTEINYLHLNWWVFRISSINSITGVIIGHQPKQYTEGNPSKLIPPKGAHDPYSHLPQRFVGSKATS